MKVTLTLLTAGVVIFGTSCASIKVKSEYRKQVDFTEYKTYDWIEQPERPFAYLTSIVNRKGIVKAIKENVDNKLLLRGYRRVESDPDFLVVYHANVKGKIQTAPIGYDSRMEMYVERNITVRDYQEGSLVLDFVEAKSNSLVWRGIAVGAVQDEGEDPGANQSGHYEIVAGVSSQKMTWKPDKIGFSRRWHIMATVALGLKKQAKQLR